MERESRYGAFTLLTLVFVGVFFLAHFGMRRIGPDAMAVHIPARLNPPSHKIVASSNDNMSVVNVSVDPVKKSSGMRARKDSRARKLDFPGFPVDINSAGVEELMKVPGIGPKTARRIVEKRVETGGFRSINELTGVQRIGRVKLESMRRYITVSAVMPSDG